jgi:hypothetical protein
VKRRLAFLSCTMLAGCGGGYPAPVNEDYGTAGGETTAPEMMMVEPEEAALVDRYPSEMNDLAIQLDEAMPESQSELDCDMAGSIKDRICDLSARICSISERHPADESVRDKCTDGQARCARAERDVGARCG